MADAYSHEGYCDLAKKEEKFSDKALVIGVYAVFVALFSVVYWYAVTHGININTIYLP